MERWNLFRDWLLLSFELSILLLSFELNLCGHWLLLFSQLSFLKAVPLNLCCKWLLCDVSGYRSCLKKSSRLLILEIKKDI